MKKLFLFIFVLCTLISCTYVPAGPIYDIPVSNGIHRYEIIEVVIDDHDYIYLDGYSGENHIMHDPECKKCQIKQTENDEEDLFSW